MNYVNMYSALLRTMDTVFTLGVDIYFSDFTLKTPIFNKICLFDYEKVHFEHITKQF